MLCADGSHHHHERLASCGVERVESAERVGALIEAGIWQPSPTAAACRYVRSDCACGERLGESGRAVEQLLSSDAQRRRAGEGNNTSYGSHLLAEGSRKVAPT
jgi:hypothetical protein